MKRPAPSLEGTIFESFALIEDPRAANASYSLQTVLFCLIVGVLSGADGFVEAEEIARMKKGFIRKYVKLDGDVPSHDTMTRVLAVLDADQFMSAFAVFMERLTGHKVREILNLDGKTLRGVVGTAGMKRNRSEAAKMQHQMVSLFSATRNIVLGQLKTKNSVNEVSAGRDLLRMVDVHGGIVTMDAMHLTIETLQIVDERGADVVVTVKESPKAVVATINDAFNAQKPIVVTTEETKRGVIERRKYEVVAATPTNFRTAKSFVRVTRENVSHDVKPASYTNPNVTHYITSLPPKQAQLIARCIRDRWGIENKLHHVLDVAFDEDRSRIRTRNAAENFSRIRHLAFNLLGLKKGRLSFPLARMKAAMDDTFLARALKLAPR